MGNYTLKNNDEIVQVYEMVKAKYEEMEKKEKELELAVSKLRVKRTALIFEKDNLAIYEDIYEDIAKELNDEIIKLEKEIDGKEELILDISNRLDVYFNKMEKTVEARIKKYS